MNRYEREIAQLRRKVAELQAQLAKRTGRIDWLEARIRELEAQIEQLEADRKFFKDQSNINLAENRRLWDRLRGNPYSDESYNER